MSLSPLGGITLGSIPQSAKIAIFDCPIGTFLCADTDTLAQAKAAGAIKQNAKVQDLGYYKDASGHDITLKDFVKGLPPNTTLEDLLATVLLKTAYDWEELPLPGFPIQDFSTDGGTVTYTVSVLLNGGGAPVDSTIGVHIPPGARYVPNSTILSGGPGTIDGEPTLSSPENELTWHVDGLALDTSYELSFRAKPGLSLGTEAATAKIAATGLDGTVNAPNPASTLITEPGEPTNGAARHRAAGPARHALPRLHLERLGPRLLPGPGRAGRAADDPSQPPERGRRPRHLRADDRTAADAASRRRRPHGR